MATIKDVAREAGVATSTASYALNGVPKVSEETRQKVLRAAKKLNYVPNVSARSLKLQRTETIGVFLNDFSGPLYSELLRGINKVAAMEGYDLIASSIYGKREGTVLKFLEEKRVDGAILLCASVSDEIIKKAASDDFPIVVLDRELKHDNIYSVILNNEGGMYSAIEHLIKLGHEDIAYITGPKDSYDANKRFLGYRRALADHGYTVRRELIVDGNFEESSGYQGMKLLLASNIDIDAVAAANDEMAIGAIRAVKESGLEIPRDISIVGFDDIQLAEYITPSLTTVNHPKYEWGEIAAKVLLNAINGEKNSMDTIMLPSRLVMRKSTGLRTS